MSRSSLPVTPPSRYHGPDSPLTQTAHDLSDEFEESFDRRIRALMAENGNGANNLSPKPSTDGGVAENGANNVSPKPSADGDVNWAEVVEQLGALDYADLPVATRVNVLRWLAEEVRPHALLYGKSVSVHARRSLCAVDRSMSLAAIMSPVWYGHMFTSCAPMGSSRASRCIWHGRL
jgi:hypothetical protein